MNLFIEQIEKRVKILKAVSLFSQTSENYLKQIAELFTPIHFNAEQCIFEKGGPGDSMYVISYGKVKIHDGSHIFITLDSEQSFGEFALIDSKVRTASATATEDSELLRLDKATFFSLYEKSTEFSMGILQSIVKRFNDKDFLEAQLTQQKKEIEEKNKEIEEINKDITASIRYAKRIQQAVLFMDPKINCFVKESLIFFKPKDIVSGDFYWIQQIKNRTYIAVADCTGHGVPGAFMSMLGVAFLNEIITKFNNPIAGDILNQLRINVKRSLHQTGRVGEQKDGMDIVFIAVDLETYTMHFAGANNPLWLIRKNDKCSTEVNGLSNVNIINNDESCLIEFKPSKMPIGIHETMNSFADYVFQLQRGDILYLSSDGFEDQFGGPKNKKFLSKNLKKLLLANSDLSLSEQKQLLIDALNEWKGNNEQVDDITIVGIKI